MVKLVITEEELKILNEMLQSKQVDKLSDEHNDFQSLKSYIWRIWAVRQ